MAEQETKRCTKCGKTKPFVEFNRDRRASTGIRCKCKMCEKKYRIENREIIRVQQARRDAKRMTPEGKERLRQYVRKNREKVTARQCVNHAIRSGKITRPDCCSCCGEKCRPQAHHEDYNKPLEVIFLCQSCHLSLHAEKERGEPYEIGKIKTD